jgi:hypothetical protein
LQDAYPAQRPDHEPAGLGDLGMLLVLPVCFVLLAVYLRGQAGPFWQWNLLDPAYFYLLDALNLLNGDPPGHIYHPGITVQAVAAVALKLRWLAFGGDVAAALADPEVHLTWLSNAFIALNAVALAAVGLVARRVFGSLLPALAIQLAPFMSTIVVKHAFLPKPEALLVFATLALIGLALAMLRNETTPSARNWLAVGFGVVAGFTVVTKITAVPVLVLGLFALRGWRAWLIFAASSLLAAVLFYAPAHGTEAAFVEYVMRVTSSTGAHGSGGAGVVDLDAYPDAFIKILKRPALKVPLILSLLALAACWLRARRGHAVAAAEVRLVLGVAAAQLAQTAIVAKQATAFYMIPSYMLAALSVLLSVRLLWAARPARLRLPVDPAVAGAAAFAVFVAAQTAGMERLATELTTLRDDARHIDNSKFTGCARIYIYAASEPTYALYLADYVTGSRFAKALKARLLQNDFWIDDWWAWEPVRLKDWSGPRDFAQVRALYPCVYMRGNRPGGLRRFLEAQPGGAAGFDFSCRAGIEATALLGVDCQGRRR